MRRSVPHYLFIFSLIAALLFDMSGSFANSCPVGTPAVCCGCCCCDHSGAISESCCCCGDDTSPVVVCTCGCSGPQSPAVPSGSPTDENRLDHQRSVVLKAELPVGDGGFQAENAEQFPFSALRCASRRRAILCCWIT